MRPSLNCWTPVTVQLLSHVWFVATPWSSVCQAPLSFTVSLSLLRLLSSWLSDDIYPSHSLLSPSHFAVNIFQHQGLFQWASSSIKWPKYWSFSFSFSISPSDEYSELISFRIQWFDLAVQGTLRSLLDMITALKSAYIIPMPVCIPSPMCICLWTARSSLCCFTYILYLEYT